MDYSDRGKEVLPHLSQRAQSRACTYKQFEICLRRVMLKLISPTPRQEHEKRKMEEGISLVITFIMPSAPPAKILVPSVGTVETSMSHMPGPQANIIFTASGSPMILPNVACLYEMFPRKTG